MSSQLAGERLSWAWAAFHQQDWNAAIALWCEVRCLLPDNVAGFLGGALALRQAGQFAQAEALLTDATRRFPDDHDPVIQVAWMAIHRQDWRAGFERFSAARARFADRSAVYVGGIMALHAYGENALLYVRPEGAAHPNGTVEAIHLWLMIGYIDRLMSLQTSQVITLPLAASWLVICRRAYSLWQIE